MLERWRAPLVRIVKYGGIDTVLFPLNLVIAWRLTEQGMNYQLATVAGFFIHITIAFFFNYTWTFRSHLPKGWALVKTWGIGATDLGIAVIATTLLKEYGGFSFFWARFWAGAVVFGWDYVLNSLITFKTKPFS